MDHRCRGGGMIFAATCILENCPNTRRCSFMQDRSYNSYSKVLQLVMFIIPTKAKKVVDICLMSIF